jgi:uncharacterized protein YuzE
LESPYWPFKGGLTSAGRPICPRHHRRDARPGARHRHGSRQQAQEDAATHDPTVDVLRIVLSTAPIEECDEEKPGMSLDRDKDGSVVGFELLDVSKRTDDPCSVEFAVAG